MKLPCFSFLSVLPRIVVSVDRLNLFISPFHCFSSLVPVFTNVYSSAYFQEGCHGCSDLDVVSAFKDTLISDVGLHEVETRRG